MDTNIVIVPNSAVLPRKALRISPNESMDQKVNNKDSNRARIFRHGIDREQKHILKMIRPDKVNFTRREMTPNQWLFLVPLIGGTTYILPIG